jgi:MFS transporter, ACS family, hexuronate transporter
MSAVTSQQSGPRSNAPPLKASPATHFRWTICALLFFATTLNYMDRQVLSLLKPTLQDPVRGIGMTEVQFAAIVSIFSAAYALGLLLAGGFVDRVGTRIGYAVALGIWTLASMSHTLARFPFMTRSLHGAAGSLASLLRQIPGCAHAPALDGLAKLSGAIICFGLARFLLGLGEAGNFPSAIKAVAEWFPSRERALATGIFNSGTNIGATIAPFVVVLLLYRFGWQYAFLGTSAFAAIWLVLWLSIYRAPRDHPRVSLAELAIINSDPAQPQSRVAWSRLLPHRQTWAFLLGKALTDPPWWFYLYWLPGFLSARYRLTLAQMGVPLLIIYNVCTVGSVAGGWLPQRLIRMGWSLNRSRKTAMLFYALAVVPVVFIGHTHALWQAVALICLATAAHQAWSANMFTLASDMFPRSAVGSVVGVGACCGSVAMMFFGLFIGFVLEITKGNYTPVFLLAGTAYLLAIVLIQLLAPRLEVARLN